MPNTHAAKDPSSHLCISSHINHFLIFGAGTEWEGNAPVDYTVAPFTDGLEHWGPAVDIAIHEHIHYLF
jgi:hypothetical protein